jgi:hypothetical protein
MLKGKVHNDQKRQIKMAIRLQIQLSAILCLGACLTPVTAQSQDFYNFWGDGRAEVSSYRVVQPRYGEDRVGYGVMIYVTEDVRRSTLIKIESPTPEEERLYTLKLNNFLKFTTGVYDYSVMTSAFSVIDPLTQEQPFELLKLNLSSQEWCGHVFEEVRVEQDRLLGALNSYFESEGLQQWSFERPDDFESEDHLLIRIRELKGEFMASESTRTLTMLPSLWQFRMRHKPRELVTATLTKGTAGRITVGDVAYTAIPWTWSYEAWEKTVWIDTAYPHRVLQWQTSDGGRGELLVSKRLPYWGLHDLADEYLRDELKIPR